MQHYVERVNRFLDGWLEKDGYRRLLTEFVEEDHQYYLRVYIDFLDSGEQEHAPAHAEEAEKPLAADQADEKIPEKNAGEAEEAVQGDGAQEEAPLHTIGINDCANVSRRLSKWLDQQDFIKEVYTLEVCSRGFLPDDPEDTEDIEKEEVNTEKNKKAANANHKEEEYNGR